MVDDGTPALTPLGAFLARDWVAWLAEKPDFATEVGHPDFNDRWIDDSPQGIEARRRHLIESLEAVRQFEPSRLAGAERLSHRLYRSLLEEAVRGLEYGDDPFPFHLGYPRNLWVPLNQMDGIQIQAGDTLQLQPRRTRKDFADLLARLRALPVAIDQSIALLRRGLEHEATPPRVAIHGVPDQIRGLLAETPAESVLLRPFQSMPSGLPESDRARIVADAEATYRDRTAPAVRRFLEYVEREYLPHCRETIAASGLPGGAAAYSHHVRWQTTTDLSPQQIHDLGMSEVVRLRAAMEALMRSTGFSGTAKEFHEFLRTHPSFYYASGPELLAGYRAIAKSIDPELPNLFGLLPRQPYGVVPVPDYRASNSPSAYYVSGSLAAGRAGTFFANTADVSKRPKWEMEALTLHEAVPGHHLQLALNAEIEDLPEFRRRSGPTAFIEGWGLYAESLGEEVGMYHDPYAKFGQLTYDMWRSLRLVVDTGMHALGWSRERAIDMLRSETGRSEIDITFEVDRYIVWPGQALAYKVGQLKFRELRTYAEHRLGERFDVRAFHDVVLGEGALPLDELEHRVRAWVDEELARPVPV